MNDNIPNLNEQPGTSSSEEAALSKQRAQELYEVHYPKPLPLQRELSPPNKFPFEALGPFLGAVAQKIHEVVKAPDSICGQSTLAVAALVAQAHADVYIDGRTSTSLGAPHPPRRTYL